MAMYSAYFDESGTPDIGSHLVVAGCIADVKQWVEFEREWAAALLPLGITVFHATDFAQRRGLFDRLSPLETDDLLERLIGIICRRVEKTLSYAIRISQYDAINKKYIFGEWLGFPYPLAARYCMAAVAEWASRHSIPSKEVLCFFEDGAKHKGQIKWMAERDRLSVPTFLEKSQAAPLQAGDLIAWANNLYLSAGGQIDPRYRRAMDRLWQHSSAWGIVKLDDPDKLPTILGIPPRDPQLRYSFNIVRKDGCRRAIVRYRPKTRVIEPKLERGTLDIPDSQMLSAEDIDKAIAEYESARAQKP
jgi:Protein of unknown function (DUF3800)